MQGEKRRIQSSLTCALIIGIIAVCMMALCIGRYMITPKEVLEVMKHQLIGTPKEVEAVHLSVVWQIRLPRVLLALLVGMGLAAAGAAFQGLFGNPLATPDTLGVAAGAAFGAALGLLITKNMIFVQLMAFVFGIGAVGITYLIGQIQNARSILMLVLAGMVTSSLFQALISLVKYVADPETQLPEIIYWLMGSMAGVTYTSLFIGAPFIMLGLIVLYLLRWRLNILALPEEEAHTMGIHVKRLRAAVIIAATLITAACVSMCGQIGWVGLLIPHIARMLTGASYKRLIPVSMGLGGIYMVLIDTIARSITAAELPLSILTALIGAPFFAYLLRRTGGRWNDF